MPQEKSHSDIYELIGNHLSGCISKEETMCLQTLLEKKENQQLFEQLQKIWTSQENNILEVDTEKALSLVNKRIKTLNKPSTFSFYQWVAFAASLLLVIGTFIVFNQLNSGLPTTIRTVNREVKLKSLNLIDGSLVELNEGSRLVYPKTFDSKTRDVQLEGEAYFSIKRNENKPFIVHTKFADVKVLGTAFYIKIIDNKVEVTVESGKVLVINKQDNTQFVTLTKNQKSVFNNTTSSFEKAIINPNELFWKTQTLCFNHTNIKEVVNTLNHYYDDTLIIDTSLLNSKLTLTATFKEQSIIQISNLIAAHLDLSITEKNNKITFKKL